MRFTVTILTIAVLCLSAVLVHTMVGRESLRREIADWREAAMPAIIARGFIDGVDLKSGNEITPEILQRALNPCLKADGSVVRDNGGRCEFAAKYTVMTESVPIEIIHRRQ